MSWNVRSINRHFAFSLWIITLTACTSTTRGIATTGSASASDAAAPRAACREGQAGLRLPAGFCATIFADSVGAARHLVVASNGDVFVNLRSSRRGPLASIAAGQVGLRDTNGDGRADVIERFGTAGGTGIGLYNGFVYADHGTSIVRFPLPAGQLRPGGAPEIVVSGLPGQPGHDARNFAITPDGTLYVNVGSPSNACQEKDRAVGSPGKPDCPELLTRAGIWKFDAKALGQTPSISSRHATGVRNAVALTVDPQRRLIAIPHGRDQLSQNWPALFTPEQNAELPAEMFVEINAGDDFGWPYCYYDGIARQYRLAPEYGGNGTTAGRCERLEAPMYPFPAHWAPNGALFYTGSAFPAKYRSGVFVAFHGSWNRAPLPQQGFKVAFLPLRDNTAAAPDFEIFADGFTVENPPPNGAAHRPVGLAQGPDGALYISDDVGGRIWRVTWTGG